jgi:hypothetical protein
VNPRPIGLSIGMAFRIMRDSKHRLILQLRRSRIHPHLPYSRAFVERLAMSASNQEER